MFGKFIKEQRIKKRIGLREFCKKYNHDPSNWSKIEREVLPPPNDENKLKEWATQLEVDPGSSDWYTFFDLAFTEKGRIPADIMKDEEIVKKLPLFFRTLRGQKPTEEELRNLVEIIRGS